MLINESELWQRFQFLAGVDEVGRGCLAGPVVSAAVILPNNPKKLSLLSKVNDSKKLTKKSRKELLPIIQEIAVDYGIGLVSHNVIDKINILQATFLSMRRSLNCLDKFQYVLVDGNKIIPKINEPQKYIIKGDSNSLSIACASILAKVFRDEIMIKLSSLKEYNCYSFEKHKGYATKVHIEAIKKNGISNIHRKTFCKNFLNVTKFENLKMFI